MNAPLDYDDDDFYAMLRRLHDRGIHDYRWRQNFEVPATEGK